MPTHVDLTLPVPYQECVRTASGAILWRTAFAEIEVRLPFIDVRQTYLSGPYVPKLAEARLRAADGIEWFAHGGRPVRSLLVVKETSDRIGFARTDRFWWRFWREQELMNRDWLDYPFPGWSANGPEAALACGEVVDSDLPLRLVEARRIAETLTCDGERVYKPAPLPVWTVEDLRRFAPGTTRLSLVLPDKDRWFESGGRHARLQPAFGLFGAGDAEAALGVSRELFGAAPYPGPRRRPVEDINTRLCEFAVERRRSDRTFFEALGALRLCRSILDGMLGRDPWEIGGDRFEDAVAGIRSAVDRVRPIAFRHAPGSLSDELARLAEATRHARDVLGREAHASDETLFLLRVANSLGTSRRSSVIPDLDEADIEDFHGPRF